MKRREFTRQPSHKEGGLETKASHKAHQQQEETKKKPHTDKHTNTTYNKS
jgi:hypothetical protein